MPMKNSSSRVRRTPYKRETVDRNENRVQVRFAQWGVTLSIRISCSFLTISFDVFNVLYFIFLILGVLNVRAGGIKFTVMANKLFWEPAERL